MSASSRNLLVRIVSASVLGSLVIASDIWCEPVFALLCLVVTVICIDEWTRMAKSRKVTFAIGWLYIILAGSSLIVLRHEAGSLATLALLFPVWATDIGGFAAGKTFGGPKLAPVISPKKTWAGAIGGLYVGAGVAWLCAELQHASHPSSALAFGTAISIVTQLGDLLESAAKRRFGVKDSGWIMPGHGGILDRVDGLLLASLVYFTWYFFFTGATYEF